MIIAQLLHPFSIALIIVGSSLLVFSFVLYAFYIVQRRRGLYSPTRAGQGDLANMTILMQTMRDMLQQQKDLARQLNESLDKKVAFIRESVDHTLDDLEALRGAVRATAEQIATAKNDIARMQVEIRQVKTEAGEARPRSSENAPGGPDPESPPESAPETVQGARPPELQVLARPAKPRPVPDLLDTWAGLDFGGDEPDPQGLEVPDEVPEAPENPEAAREAFRALLNIEERRAETKVRRDAPAAGEGGGGNGRKRLSPLQTRVYEFSDAGMTVSQIAQEIGIGKGEVRLILSLRKDRSR